MGDGQIQNAKPITAHRAARWRRTIVRRARTIPRFKIAVAGTGATRSQDQADDHCLLKMTADLNLSAYNGQLTPEEQATANAAWLAAAQSWLSVIPKSEGFWEGETEERLQAAAQQLEDALGLNRSNRRRGQDDEPDDDH